jgi:hypothetical protein
MTARKKKVFEFLGKRGIYLNSLFIFLTAGFVRFLIGQESRFEAEKVQGGLVLLYRNYARFLVEDGFLSFFDAQARAADLEYMGHPPGYSFVLAAIFSTAGDSNFAVQTFSALFDALSAVLIFLIVRKLLGDKIAVVTGFFAAFSPQFALNSIFILPDTLSVFPILLATYFLVLALEKPRFFSFILTGICLGASCWLRANSLLLPLFFVGAIWLLFDKKRGQFSVVLLAAFILIVAPLTVRNAIVFRKFIPVSLGAGQILLEGIGEYDKEKKFGIPATDAEVCDWEAEKYGKPEYKNTLFGKDGIWRDRMRLKTGFEFIAEHPFWFAKLMIRRSFSMLKLEKAQKISPEASITQVPSDDDLPLPVWEKKAARLAEEGSLVSSQAAVTLSADDNLLLYTDETKYDPQFIIETNELKKNREYLFDLRLQLKAGRISIKIVGSDSDKIYFSLVEALDWRNEAKATQLLRLYAVPDRDERVKIVIGNETPNPPTSVVEIRHVKMFDLGEAAFTWTRFPRLVVGFIQKIFTTNVMLPLAIGGLAVLIRRKKRAALVTLLTVPLYYLSVQSALHTEYRYVLAMQYFLFALAAVTTVEAFGFLTKRFYVLYLKFYSNAKTYTEN